MLRATHVTITVVLLLPGAGCGGAKKGDDVVEVTASQVPDLATTARIHLVGTPLPEHAIDFAWPEVAPPRWFHLVPVVDEAWSEGAPVPVWVTTSSSREDVSAWKDALVQAMQRGAIDATFVTLAKRGARERASGWQAAIEAGEAEGGLLSHPRAPIVTWPPP